MKEELLHNLKENKYFITFIYTLIVLSIIALILESYADIRATYSSILYGFEIMTVAIFTLEYLLRLWVADIDIDNKNSRFTFFRSTFGIIDLLAILPFFLPMIFPFDLRFIRIFRLLRLLRIFKLGRYSKSLRTIQAVLHETRSDLAITLFVTLILLIFSSTLMYYVEYEAQPDQFSSIVHTFWWSVATLTTVGYGDIYPITALGKVLSAIIAIIGIGFVALPTGIISSAFVDRLQQDKQLSDVCTCPKCDHVFQIRTGS